MPPLTATLCVEFRDDLELIQLEMRELTEQYSIKCLENASLEERLDVQTRALHSSRKRVQDLLARYGDCILSWWKLFLHSLGGFR